jgi:hypothetical protein
MDEELKIGRIYKIFSSSTDKIYIGSTTKTINKRLIEHRTDYKRYLNNNNYSNVTSFEIVQYDDAKIELIEELRYTEINELRKKERYFIELNWENCVNKNIPSRTRKESGYIYRALNKESMKEWSKIYRELNKEKLAQKFICECGSLLRKSALTRHNRTKKHINYFNITINITINGDNATVNNAST